LTLAVSPARAGRHEHRLAFAERGIRVAAGIEQRLEHRGVADRRGFVQRRHAEAVHGVRVGALGEQPFDGVEIVAIRRPVQRGRRGVGGALLREQRRRRRAEQRRQCDR
jgi:hypothetical protein